MRLDDNEVLHVHPFILFVCCCILYTVQFWLTFCAAFGGPPYWKTQQTQLDSEEENLHTSTKLLLVIIVQLTFFDCMLVTLRNLIFVLNPTTWTDICRIDPHHPRIRRSRMGPLYWSEVLAPLPIFALLFKFLTQYYVSVQSVSIILGAEGLKDAIFDSLAISFILELDQALWHLLSTLMKLDSFSEFTFRLWPEARRMRNMREHCFVRLIDKRWLHRGFGSRRLEGFVAFLILLIIYTRFTFIMAQAIDTGVLPAARDLCSQWHWHQGIYKSIIDRVVGKGFNMVVGLMARSGLFPWDVHAEINKLADPSSGGFCNGEDAIERLTLGQTADLLNTHPGQITSTLIFFAALLLLPELVYSTGALQTAVRKFNLVSHAHEYEEEVQEIGTPRSGSSACS